MLHANPKHFEQLTRQFLELSGYSVQAEQQLGHKKVDLLATLRHLGSTLRIAVECKTDTRSIDRDFVAKIYSDYAPLHTANLIDEILLVTSVPLTPAALAYVNETRTMRHQTLADIQNNMIDFRLYLQGLLLNFEEAGLSQYYVHHLSPAAESEALIRFNDKTISEFFTSSSALSGTLEADVLQWLGQPIPPTDRYWGDLDLLVRYLTPRTSLNPELPLAVIASYGMGKTSFALRLASVLAQQALSVPQARIPILVRLGDISNEQSLEGLLGKVFTAHSTVRNYSFDAFMSLNKLGRLVVILDGFDEMKHTLSWDAFCYNFRELNRLVCAQSRVIILGRPTAFLSDEEFNHAIKGIRIVGEEQMREPGWPEYQPIELRPFARQQIRTFLHRYISHQRNAITNVAKESKISFKELRKFDKAEEAIAQISDKRLIDLARRPVQLRMLAEVLPQWKKDVDELTVCILYQFFIDLMIEREMQKEVRRFYSADVRRHFAGDLAFWMWIQRGTMNLTEAQIPDEVVAPYGHRDENLDAVRRDLLSACFLERKLGGAFYFPHRSFQEFLVAETICRRIGDAARPIPFGDVNTAVTVEVGLFIEGLVGRKHLSGWHGALCKYRGDLKQGMIRAWISNAENAPFILSKMEESECPWYVLFIALMPGLPRAARPSVSDVLLGRIRASTDARYVLLCVMAGILRQESHFFVKSVEYLMQNVEVRGFFWLKEFLKKISISKNFVSVAGFRKLLFEGLHNYCLVQDWIVGNSISVEIPERFEMSVDERESLSRLLEKQGKTPDRV